MREFEGKTAVITGAASGIGRGLAERFAQARMNVVLADIEKDALARVTKELEERQHRVLGVVTNTMRRDSIQSLLEKTTQEFGKVHILCNNAGVTSATTAGKPIWEIPDADWEWVMGVNFWGVLYGVQTFVPHMLAHGEPSHIVNTASLAAWLPGGGTYGVSKHGVLALSEGLLRDLRLRQAKIGVSVLCPGFVNTQIFNSERNRPSELNTNNANEEGMAQMSALLSQGKQPSEVAENVFNSIVEDRHYILPHPAWDPYLRARVEAAIARAKEPSAIDFEDMVRRRAAGEQF